MLLMTGYIERNCKKYKVFSFLYFFFFDNVKYKKFYELSPLHIDIWELK